MIGDVLVSFFLKSGIIRLLQKSSSGRSFRQRTRRTRRYALIEEIFETYVVGA